MIHEEPYSAELLKVDDPLTWIPDELSPLHDQNAASERGKSALRFQAAFRYDHVRLSGRRRSFPRETVSDLPTYTRLLMH